MDAFTENILARARERQKLLEGYSQESTTPLRENNKITISEPNLNEIKPIPRKEIASDSNIPSKLKDFGGSTKENVSEGNLLPSKGIEMKENKSESDLNRFTRQNSLTKISSNMPGSPRSQAKTLNIQRDNFNMEIKVTSLENVRVQVEIEEHTDDEDETKNVNDDKLAIDDKTSGNSSDTGSQISSDSGMREESRNRFKRLGRLYAGGEEADISSPIHRTEARFYQELEQNSSRVSGKNSDMPLASSKAKKGLSKLAALADEINHWEDDLSHPKPAEKKSTSPRRGWKPPAPQPPSVEKSPQKSPAKKPKAPSPPVSKSSETGNVSSSGSPRHDPHKFLPSSPTASRGAHSREASPTKGRVESLLKSRTEGGAQCVGATPKKINWDKAVLDTLESQGFTRSTSDTRLVYSYNHSQDNHPSKVHTSTAQIDVKSPLTQEDAELEANPHQEEKTDKSGLTKPSSRSDAIAKRAAMFECNKKDDTPAAKTGKDPAFLSLSERKALFEKNKGEALVPKAAFGMSAPVKLDTTMKACESKLIGASKSNESIKSVFEMKENVEKHVRIIENVEKSSKSVEKSKEIVEKSTKPAEKPSAANQKSSKVKNHAPKPPPLAQKPAVTSQVAAVHQSGGIASTVAALLEKKSTISEEQIFNQAKSERQKEIEMLLNRFNKNKGILEREDDKIEELQDSSDEDDMDETSAMIKPKDRPASIVSAVSANEQSRKSAEKRKSGGSRLSCDSDHPQVVSVLEDVKRIKVSPPKSGRLYPCLSDIEATTGEDTRTPSPDEFQEENSLNDSQCDSDDPNTSFGRDILQAVVKNQSPSKKIVYPESTGSEGSSIMGELDEILDEYDDDDEYSSSGPTPPKQGRQFLSPEARPSNSFHYKSYQSPSKSPSKTQNFQSPIKSVYFNSPRPSSELPVVVEAGQVMPLTHTVSFYRKQQSEKTQTPAKKVVMQPLQEETEQQVTNNDDEVKEKIKELQEEVNRQQNIISQTSQALNLCSSTPEFSGSTEQVEAERVLLLASHRRQVVMHELQRLRVEGNVRAKSAHSKNLPLEKGTLTISNIVLPLKQKYVTALAAGGKGHHVVCLVKCGEQVVSTKLVSTVASSSKNPDVDLYVPGSVTLKNIYSDFTVTFEVYCLQAQEECLPHEVKYHINKKGSKNSATPKKSKQESRLARPPKESPAGPQAVRTSSFALMGYIVFSVQAVNKKVWSLNNTPPMSPLEGSVEMKISCELAVSVEQRGFLTMFEDVSGFGAWHRRWCLLKGDTLSYWKYPDNEKKMPPIDTIDLNTCITESVGPVSREICARMHTFLLERERDALPQDKDSLVSVRNGDKTIIRHLLSADTKEERIEWCQKLNSSLAALRMWGSSQH